MSSPDTAGDGLPAHALFRHMTMPPVRRRTMFKRMTMAMRDHAGMGVFVAMLVACGALIILSR